MREEFLAVIGGDYVGVLGRGGGQGGYPSGQHPGYREGERGDGTEWFHNYPRAMRKGESCVYIHFCDKTGVIPMGKYAHQLELSDQAVKCKNHIGLCEKAVFGAHGAEIRDKEAGRPRWTRVATPRRGSW